MAEARRRWTLGAALGAMLLGFAGLACADDGTGPAMETAPAEDPAGCSGERVGPRLAPELCSSTRAEDLVLLRARLLERIEASGCPDVDCPLVRHVPVPAAPVPDSEDERILLLDEAILTAAATRYETRTLAYLRRGADGTYATYLPELELPEDAHFILRTLSGRRGPLAAEEIALIEPFSARFGSRMPPWLGHAMDILPFLADRIPQAQFVVSEDLLDFGLDDPAVCRLLEPGTREAALVDFEAQLVAARASLQAIVATYGIRYIHLAWGMTRQGLEESLEHRCGALPPRSTLDRLQRLYLELIEGLAASTSVVRGTVRPVVLFQAGTGASRLLREGDPDYLSDCTPIPHRLRIFSLAHLGTEIPAGGSSDRRFFSPLAERVRACVDLYVNLGYEDPLFGPYREPHFYSTPLGLGRAPRPSWPPTSSFATPVALAYFVNFAAGRDAEVEALIDEVTHQHATPVIDPLLHGELPRPFSGGVPAR